MARFYDVVDGAELARIEAVLKNGGVEYALTGASDSVREILVAEEDLAYAEQLLATVPRDRMASSLT
jgi:hypothetical protein